MHPKVLAIHLPQFHPFPENDAWWGKGFTEWTNVTQAKPHFKGHYQPQLPTDLGFYDLRNPDSYREQYTLAKEYGIEGFSFYHYWFHGKRLMHEPIDAILKDKALDFPFCLFWANESWSRRWMGDESSVLIEQTYSQEDDIAHAEWLCKAFADPRYIKVNGRPLFLFYRPYALPDANRTTQTLREVCKKNGLPNPFLVASNSHDKDADYQRHGFDFALNFETRHHLLWDFQENGSTLKKFLGNLRQGIFSSRLKVYPYKEYKKRAANLHYPYPGFPCVNVGFDNTARRGKNAIILHGQSKELFKESLIDAKKKAAILPAGQELIFINAWNEWAEGNQLEPSRKFGRQFLEAVKEVFR